MYVTFFRRICFQMRSRLHPHAVRGFNAAVPLCALHVELHVMSYIFIQ